MTIKRLTSILAAGRRHSSSDQQMVQTVHDHAVALGAMCGAEESVDDGMTLDQFVASLSDDDASALSAALAERAFSAEQRAAMAKSGEAMPDGGYPIANVADLRNAISAYGRGVNKPAVKAHIIKRAKALDATDELPADWEGSTKQAEAGATDLTGGLVPLVEKAVKQDGTISLRIIAPGHGSSGYYPADMLKRDGPRVFTSGLHMHLDHPSLSEESDRPERSVTTLAGVLTSNARWEDHGAAGPGLYAEAKLRGDVAPLIEELAPHIGVSIRAMGKAASGEVDGKKTRVIESIEQAKSVDFVTVPGAGGRVLELVEAARGRRSSGASDPATEVDEMDKAEFEAAKAELAEARKQIAEQGQALARLREANLLRDAHAMVTESLAAIALPEPTRRRLAAQLAANPPLKDDALDRAALATMVTEAAKAEMDYLASVAPVSAVKGMGGAPAADGSRAGLIAAFKEAGYPPEVAEQMAAR